MISPLGRLLTGWKGLELGRVLAVAMLALVTATGVAVTPAPVGAAEPPAAARAVVDGFYATLVDVMRQGKTLGFDGRYRRLQDPVGKAFNLAVMARIAVGPTVWRDLDEAGQRRLVDRFTTFSVANYAGNFKDYDGERFDVQGVREAPGGRVIVDTAIVPKGEAPVDIDYLLEQFDGHWRIIDVFLSGTISELATRRSEFGAVLKRDGLEGLLAMLDQKVREMRAG